MYMIDDWNIISLKFSSDVDLIHVKLFMDSLIHFLHMQNVADIGFEFSLSYMWGPVHLTKQPQWPAKWFYYLQ